jgi:hypothetical protein
MANNLKKMPFLKYVWISFAHSSEVGKHNFFLSPQWQFPQREGLTSAIAIPQLFKEILHRNRNSAIAIFSEVRNLRASLGLIHEKKIGGKKSRVTVLLRQVFGFQRNRQF